MQVALTLSLAYPTRRDVARCVLGLSFTARKQLAEKSRRTAYPRSWRDQRQRCPDRDTQGDEGDEPGDVGSSRKSNWRSVLCSADVLFANLRVLRARLSARWAFGRPAAARPTKPVQFCAAGEPAASSYYSGSPPTPNRRGLEDIWRHRLPLSEIGNC